MAWCEGLFLQEHAIQLVYMTTHLAIQTRLYVCGQCRYFKSGFRCGKLDEVIIDRLRAGDVFCPIGLHDAPAELPFEIDPPPFRKSFHWYARGALKRLMTWLRVCETPKRIRETRLTLCGGCDQNVRGKCLKCGCPVSAKVRLATEACPIGEWKAVDGKLCGLAKRLGAEPERQGCGGG